jgi:uncharacterized membrane protein YciS (DUF1049 family)
VTAYATQLWLLLVIAFITGSAISWVMAAVMFPHVKRIKADDHSNLRGDS